MPPPAPSLGSRRRSEPTESLRDKMATRHGKPDNLLVIVCAILLAIGLIVIYAISPALAITTGVNGSYFVERQMLAITLAIITFLVTANVPLERWRKSYKLLLAVGILATLVAVVLPVNPNYPAHRWVRLGSLSFESVELLKFALLIWLAHFLATQSKKGLIKNLKKTAIPILGVTVAVGVIVAGIQSDLGSAGVIVAMMGVMTIVAKIPLKRILLFGALILLGTTIAIVSTPYRLARLETFLHPDTNCQTTGYQACQAIIAVGSGGFTGLGLGSSVQAYGYLPEADNDSIFAIYAEKFGFVGSIILLCIFASLFYRITKVGENAPDEFSRLVVVGVLTWISSQTIINIGAMVGLLPLKGITLPFISYGGTSVVFFAAAIGLVYQVSRSGVHTAPKARVNIKERTGSNDNHSHRRGLGGAYHPDPSGRSRT